MLACEGGLVVTFSDNSSAPKQRGFLPYLALLNILLLAYFMIGCEDLRLKLFRTLYQFCCNMSEPHLSCPEWRDG